MFAEEIGDVAEFDFFVFVGEELFSSETLVGGGLLALLLPFLGALPFV